MSKDINKVIKKLPEGFTSIVDGAKDQDLKSMLCQCEANIYTIDDAKEQDVKLSKAKEEVKELAAPYREAKSVQSAKITYILHSLESRGLDLEKLG